MTPRACGSFGTTSKFGWTSRNARQRGRVCEPVLTFPIDWNDPPEPAVPAGYQEPSHLLNRVADLVKNSVAANTRRAYRSDLGHFAAWGGQLPAEPTLVASYLAAYAETLSVATLVRRIATISNASFASGWPPPGLTLPDIRVIACALALRRARPASAFRRSRSGSRPGTPPTPCSRATSGTGSSSSETPSAFFSRGWNGVRRFARAGADRHADGNFAYGRIARFTRLWSSRSTSAS